MDLDWKKHFEELHLTREPTLAVNKHQPDSPKKLMSPVPSPKQTLTVAEKIIKIRHELHELQIGEEVLAKWPDDGWYYKSIVKENLGVCKYRLEDSNHDSECMYRDDIISNDNDARDTDASFEVGDPVVALHPNYAFSYAPGQVIQFKDNFDRITVRFYDFHEAEVARENVYKLHRLKLQLDIENIIELEKLWVGRVVVARNTYSNNYELGKILNRVGNGRQYTIEWSNGRTSLQNANHIFGELTRNPAFSINDNVLAPRETVYLPGRIVGIQGDQLRIKFVDGIVDNDVKGSDCYWISCDYFDDARNFYNQEPNSVNNPDAVKRRKSVDRETPILNGTDYIYRHRPLEKDQLHVEIIERTKRFEV